MVDFFIYFLLFFLKVHRAGAGAQDRGRPSADILRQHPRVGQAAEEIVHEIPQRDAEPEGRREDRDQGVPATVLRQPMELLRPAEGPDRLWEIRSPA